ncbi:MAG: lipid-A-disaccharide synthase, partial [Proteobacteria bacterium]|nr:lipid-A-disaccharide synthase [Pseudomonadota bacterium]
MHIAIVAGELSGDLLGAGLMAALRVHYPQLRFTGIGGPAMLAKGFQTIFPMEQLAVMGLVEVLWHLPELLARRRQLCRQFITDPPLAFVGIDAPDFNLGLESRLRAHGI